MPPTLALILWVAFIAVLFRFDPANVRGLSAALWVPLVELFISGSRLPSMWLGWNTGLAAQALEEGNPLDRAVRIALIVAAVAIIGARRFAWSQFVPRNRALTAVLAFGLLSVTWSDFPFVALKRWIRDLGTYLAILVVLTDVRPFEASRTLFRRLFVVLLSLSVVLIKYFPDMGRGYDAWTGAAYFSGVGTSKNMLGLLCLGAGLFFFWDLLARWPDRHQWRTKQVIAIDLLFLGMAFWLLNLADSATSRLCLAIGCAVIALANTRFAQRQHKVMAAAIPAGLLVLVTSMLLFGAALTADVARALGRDPTLTDRTVIWSVLLAMESNPLLGAGYETFWLGSRLDWIWEHGYGVINQAHNGYLQVYLNLGIAGLGLVLAYLAVGYARIGRQLSPPSGFSSLGLAVWVVLLFYNLTEAALLGGVLWTMLLPAVLSVEASPPTGGRRGRRSFALGNAVSSSREGPDRRHVETESASAEIDRVPSRVGPRPVGR